AWDEPWRLELWQVLLRDTQWIELIMKLQIRFHDGYVKVSPEFQKDPDIMDQIQLVYLYVWAFREFSDSRWITLGSSQRTMLAAELLGLSAYVDYLLNDVKVSGYYLKGFLRKTDKVLHMTALAATCSFASDETLAMTLEDDRLIIRLPEIDQAAISQLEYVFSISQPVWNYMGNARKKSGGELRSESLHASLVSSCYFNWRVNDLRKPPFSYCRGDLDENLDAIARGPVPDDPFTLQMYNLLSLDGFPREQLKTLLELLGNCPQSNITGEQGHVGASIGKKRHPTTEHKMLQTRAQLIQFRPLLNMTKEEKLKDRLLRRIDRIDHYSAASFGGRQAYVQDLSRVSATMKHMGCGVAPDAQQRIVQKHGEKWSEMSKNRRENCERQSFKRQQEKVDAINEERDKLLIDLNKVREKTRQKLDARAPFRVGSCRLSDAQKESLDALYADARYTHEYVSSRISDAEKDLGEPTQRELSVFRMVEEEPKARPPHPPWVATVCRNKDFFKHCSLRWPGEHEARVEKFIFSMENPFIVGLLRLQEIDVDHAAKFFDAFPDQGAAMWRESYRLDFGMWSYTDDLGAVPLDPPEILQDCVYQRHGFITSDSEWVTMDSVIGLLDQAGGPPLREGAEGSSQPTEPPPWVDLPWLLDVLPTGDPDADPAAKGTKKRKRASTGDEGEEVDIMDLDISADEVYDILRAHRDAFAPAGPAPPRRDFVVILRGGLDTKKRKGVEYDVWRAKTGNDKGRKFAGDFGIGQTCDFTISRYGDEETHALAEAWVHRVAYFHDEWVAAGSPRLHTWGAVVAAYVEPEQVRDMDAPGAPPAILEGLRRLRRVVPRN
ncbi:unnamed protein product, partial [Prorocentrum cordatum]